MKLSWMLVITAFLFTNCSARSLQENSTDNHRVKRNIFDTQRRWSRLAIAYSFRGFDDGDRKYREINLPARNIIRQALKYIEDRTCLKFYRSDATAPVQEGRILFRYVPTAIICHVITGTAPLQDNVITLNDNCRYQIPLLIRYIMHASGFHAMTSRPDAATHVAFNAANTIIATITGDAADNANGLTAPATAPLIPNLLPFEFGSILMYSPTEFTDRTRPRYAVISPFEDFQNSMGTGRVTFLDMKMINDNYCTNMCYLSTKSCQKGGYISPPNCDTCICPDGYAGNECDERPSGNIMDRNRNLIDPTRGRTLVATSAWQSTQISFGQAASIGIRDTFMERVDWITAPSDKRIQVRVTNMLDMVYHCNQGCTTAGVELKTTRILAGVRICCADLINKIITSTVESPMPIISYNRWAYTNFWIEYRYVYNSWMFLYDFLLYVKAGLLLSLAVYLIYLIVLLKITKSELTLKNSFYVYLTLNKVRSIIQCYQDINDTCSDCPEIMDIDIIIAFERVLFSNVQFVIAYQSQLCVKLLTGISMRITLSITATFLFIYNTILLMMTILKVYIYYIHWFVVQISNVSCWLFMLLSIFISLKSCLTARKHSTSSSLSEATKNMYKKMVVMLFYKSMISIVQPLLRLAMRFIDNFLMDDWDYNAITYYYIIRESIYASNILMGAVLTHWSLLAYFKSRKSSVNNQNNVIVVRATNSTI